VAASTGAALAQYLNIKNSQQIAVQTAVTTAQASVDSAKAALDTANAQLQADQTNNVTANLNADAATVAQAVAKLQDAQQVLQRVSSTAQAVAITAAAGSPISTTPVAPGTTGFGPQTFSAPTVYELPENHGSVLYDIEEGMTAGPNPQPYVKLIASKIDGSAQKDFATAMTALGPPTLGPQGATFTKAGGDAIFSFTRPIVSLKDAVVLTAEHSAVPDAPKAAMKNDFAHVSLAVKDFKPGAYVLQVNYSYDNGSVGASEVAFSVK